jgi:prepilin peptidase CpaA
LCSVFNQTSDTKHHPFREVPVSSVQLLATLVSIFVITAAVFDYRVKTIPNWITVPAAIAGLLFHAAVPEARGILWALAGFAVGFSLLILPWLLGGGGMGDVKLLAALGAWLGPLVILAVFGLSAVLAACLAAGVMVSACSRMASLGSQPLSESRSAAPPRPRRLQAAACPVCCADCVSTLVVWR